MPFITHLQKNILYVHIPKAGGTTVENWLSRFGALRLFNSSNPEAMLCTPQHLTYSDIERLFPAGYFDYAFAIVRNPYSRIESAYRYQHVSLYHRPSHEPESFQKWMRELPSRLKRHPFLFDNHWRRQVDFLSGNTRIFKIEDGLDAALSRVAAETGLPQLDTALPVTNHTRDLNLPLSWGPAELDVARNLYAADFARLGYDINDLSGLQRAAELQH